MTILDLLTDLFEDAIAVLCFISILGGLHVSGLIPTAGWGHEVLKNVQQIGPLALLLATTGAAAGMKFLIAELDNSGF